MTFDEAYFTQKVWHQREEKILESKKLYTWGQIIGMFFGPKLAEKAAKRGEVVAVEHTGTDGVTRKMWEVVNFEGNTT